MPTIGIFHGKFWRRQAGGGVLPPPSGPGYGGYPAWQSGVILGSLFGPLSAWLEACRAKVAWWMAFHRRVARLDREQRAILLTTLDRVESPLFQSARLSVRETASILGFDEPHMWKGLSHEMKTDAGRAQNIYRHLEACRRTRAREWAAGRSHPNPDMNLAVELAYTGFTVVRH